jgi:hypothetical protein
VKGNETMIKCSELAGSFIMRRSAGILLTLLFAASALLAQQQPGTVQTPAKETPAAKDTITGKYEGTARAADAAVTQLTLELKNEAGKISGRLTTPQGPLEISEGALTGSKLMLKLGTAGRDGTLTGQLENEKLAGEWITGAEKRSIELKKVNPADAAALLSGEWMALADTQGGFPFSLTLKIDGEKVTGGSSSQLGESTISSGSWKDGRLNFVLDSSNGPIAMTATVVDGKLVGEFDYAGQLQGKWVATKKSP